MQSASSSIWTRVAVSVAYEGSYLTTGTSPRLSLFLYIYMKSDAKILLLNRPLQILLNLVCRKQKN